MADGVNKSTLKGYFATGQIPTQTNFEDLVDCNINTAETAVQTLSSSLDTHVVGIASHSAGIQGSGDSYKLNVVKLNNEFITTIVVDLQGLSSSAAGQTIIGTSGSDSSLFKWSTTANGNCYKAEIGVGESPAGGNVRLDLMKSSSLQATFASSVGDNQIIDFGQQMDQGDTISSDNNALDAVPVDGDFIYLKSGAVGTNGNYTAGKLIIKFYGI